jgi:restriction endonuclease S subunit
MSEENKLIPELRFPEFKNAGEWAEKQLHEIGDVVASGDLDSSAFSQESTQEHIYPIYSNSISNEGLYGYNTYSKYLPGSITITARGTLGVAFVRNTKFVGIGRLLILSNLKESSPIFVKENWNHYARIPLENGGIPQLTSITAKAVSLLYPKLKEQQKIADCLFSLDEVIAAYSQKLELLKNHKKGLMQNLFPQEGETAPKYRFKEFEKDGEWVEDILLNLALDGFSNGVFNDPKKVGSGYKLINVINMYSESPICENNLTFLELSQSEFEKNKVKYGDIFFTRSSLVPVGIAKSNIYLGLSEDITYDGHLIRMRPKKELILPVYLHYLLKTENVRRQLIAKGKTATMTTIGQADIACVEISYSKNPIEQQKIASCLSSLDALITAQVEKLELLRLHKKGLMQGLFPKIV